MSPDGQVQRVREKLTALGYSILQGNIFKVVWTSLDLESCHEFQELKALIRERRIDAVGFLDRDRIEAIGVQRLMFLSDCKENGVEPIVCQGAPFISEPEGQLIEMALAIGKERSVRRAQSGAKQGLEDRAKLKGLPPTMKAPYGYTWQGNRLVPNADYDNARLMWDMALHGATTKGIGKKLHAMGILSSRGKEYWQPSSVKAILTNPAYAGRVATLRYERRDPTRRYKGTYGKTSAREKPTEEWHFLDGLVEDPLVTWEQFIAMQERLVLNRQYAKRGAKRNYLLRGLIECQLCYRRYYGVKRTDQKPGYVCSNAWAQTYGKRCQAKPIPCDAIEEDVKAKVRSFLEDPDLYLREAEGRIQTVDDMKADLEQSIRKLVSQRDDTITQEQRALRMLSDEAFKREQKLLVTRRSWLDEEIMQRKTRLESLHQAAMNQQSVEMVRHRLQDRLDGATDDDWRFILETLRVRVYAFEDGTWDIEVNVPIATSRSTPWYTSPCSRPAIRQSQAGCERCSQPRWRTPRRTGRRPGRSPA